MRAIIRVWQILKSEIISIQLRCLGLWRLQQFEIGKQNKFVVPVHVQGQGEVQIADRNVFGYALAPVVGSGRILLQPRLRTAKISIGNQTAFSNNVSVIAMSRVSIGDNCLIGDMVTIIDSDFHEIHPQKRHSGHGKTKEIRIGNNVWIGSRAMILKGGDLGDNTVVAGMSVVTKPFPSNVLIAGNPARIVREI